MSSINIKVSDLKIMIDELIEDKVDFVEVSILEREKFKDELIPATLHFGAFDGLGGGTDYEPIEEVDVDPFYKEEFLDSVELSLDDEFPFVMMNFKEPKKEE